MRELDLLAAVEAKIDHEDASARSRRCDDVSLRADTAAP